MSPADSKEKYDYVITSRETRLERHKKKNGEAGYDYYQEQYYEYACNLCGATNLWKRSVRVNSTKCSCCSGRTRIRGINTIGDIHPELIMYFDGDDAFDPSLDHESRYDVVCPECGNRKNMRIGHLLDQNFTCDYCHSVSAKRPDLVKYFVNKVEADKIAYMSASKALLQCPDCGHQRHMDMNQLSRNGFYCDRCGDGLSFPEKFIINLLSQLNVDFVTQASSKQFDWCGKLRYDFYIPKNNIIIETHGNQHYQQYGEPSGWRTLVEEQENDKHKEILARQNGIGYYIVLNCRKSEMLWIQRSVLESQLNAIYDLSTIDWRKCAEFASKNVMKEVCDYWATHNNEATTSTLVMMFHICHEAVRKYLKHGTELGWCHYDASKELERARRKTIETRAKGVLVYKDVQCVGVFDSIAELARKSVEIYGVCFHSSTISEICRGFAKQSHGYTFKYADN